MAVPAQDSRLHAIQSAESAELITQHSACMMRDWLTASRFRDFAEELASLIDAATEDTSRWKALDDAFWTVIPFGTGGRRGKMFPVGSNAINDRTIGESAQGLADYVCRTQKHGEVPTCAIAYDTRHRSEHFAQLCTEVLLASGFKVFFLRGFRSTPELSFAVRYTKATCGIMVTASHNPPSDNAVKVYWSGGIQVLPPHDQGIIQCVMKVDQVHRVSFDEGVARGQVAFVEEEIDPAFISAVLQQASSGPRDISILYTPLHGVGATAVVPVLRQAGFTKLRLYGPQETPDGDFPNVPGNVSNPENPDVLSGAIEEAIVQGDDLVLASDPDCDRLGAAAPLTNHIGSEWKTFSGNHLSGLLCRQAIAGRQARGQQQSNDFVVTTLVTTGLVRRIAESFGLECDDTQLVGFKWICSVIDAKGPESFVFGTEESHGYLSGTHVRDKDAAVAALLMSELTATLRLSGRTPHELLDELFCTFGCHLERQISVMLPGASGMDRMKEIMSALRSDPPQALGGLSVVRIRDQSNLITTGPNGTQEEYDGVQGDLIIFDLSGTDDAGQRLPDGRFPPLGNAVAARPSGTEPKIKFYLFGVGAPCVPAQLSDMKKMLNKRLDALEEDLRSIINL